MEALAWADDDVNAMDRDPRRFPYGCFTGGSSPLDNARVFVWFATPEELLQHILEVEPRVHGLARGEGLEAFQRRIRPLLRRAAEEGLSEALRLALDPASDGGFVVDWWGSFDDLKSGRGDFARALLDDFFVAKRQTWMLEPGEEGRFIEYLKSCQA
ncbi:MAG TPA: hypothetical protein VLM41_00345 [Steroidobacteraceae bacterium]|nr:hypothetical protein [Steroidobacteraceae bacterium]